MRRGCGGVGTSRARCTPGGGEIGRGDWGVGWEQSRGGLENKDDGSRAGGSAVGGGGGSGSENVRETPEERLRGLLREMDEAVRVLEEELAAAEEKGWNLLICAVGAEVEALREGEGMLRGLLEGSIASATREEESGVENSHLDIKGMGSHRRHGEGSAGHGDGSGLGAMWKRRGFGAGSQGSDGHDGLWKGKGRTGENGGHTSGSEQQQQLVDIEPASAADGRDEEEDDEPGPELLISHTE